MFSFGWMALLKAALLVVFVAFFTFLTFLLLFMIATFIFVLFLVSFLLFIFAFVTLLLVMAFLSLFLTCKEIERILETIYYQQLNSHKSHCTQIHIQKRIQLMPFSRTRVPIRSPFSPFRPFSRDVLRGALFSLLSRVFRAFRMQLLPNRRLFDVHWRPMSMRSAPPVHSRIVKLLFSALLFRQWFFFHLSGSFLRCALFTIRRRNTFWWQLTHNHLYLYRFRKRNAQFADHLIRSCHWTHYCDLCLCDWNETIKMWNNWNFNGSNFECLWIETHILKEVERVFFLEISRKWKQFNRILFGPPFKCSASMYHVHVQVLHIDVFLWVCVVVL